MQEQFRQRIIARHRDALLRHGHHPNALYWSSAEIQELRFKILADIGIKPGDSILDVGCGFGDLSAYLQNSGIEVEYTGIDLSPDLVEKGHELYPNCRFEYGDLFDFNPAPQSYDYVMLSGALNEPFEQSEDYARRVIARMYESCRKGVAFNLLSARDEWTASRFDLQSFDPDEILAYCETLAPRCSVIEGYLKNDFTIHMHRVI